MDGRDGAILKVDGQWQIRFERHLKHEHGAVWAAITTPGTMSRWFDRTEMPEPLAVGAAIRFYHSSLDRWSEGEITRLEPPRMIEWLWRGGFGPPNLILWEITPEPGGCRLTMRQAVEDLAILGRTTAGWHVCLDRLAASIEGAPDPGGMGRWGALFELYKQDVLAAGITASQVGAPGPPPPRP